MSDERSQSPMCGEADAAGERLRSRFNKRRVLFIAMYLIFVAGISFLGLKLYWKTAFDVPFTETPNKLHVLKHYFPKLATSAVLDTPITRDDGYFDVLLLGASVLEAEGRLLEEKLRAEVNDRLRVFNVARSAHTSRDSYLKFKHLADKQFDLIIIYHGINDARMNCCRPLQFKDDYTHCYWYKSLEAHLASGRILLPKAVLDSTRELIVLGEPRDVELLKYGRDIKTKVPFHNNIEQIVRSAHLNSLVVLMTFAYYIPDDYSHDRFQKGLLDYNPGHHQLPVEVWGTPENVALAIGTHNRVIEEIAKNYADVLFVDQEKLLGKNGLYFSDPCHLTEAGSQRFVSELVSAIVDFTARSGPNQETEPGQPANLR